MNSPKITVAKIIFLLSLWFINNIAHAQTDLKYDFGTGKLANGYTSVRATDIYSDQKGFGFDYGSKAIAVNRGGDDALNGDFCTTAGGSLFFSVKLPQGNYRVTVTLGDQLRPTETTIKAEARRLTAEKIVTKSGEFKTVSFNVSVWDSLINNKEKVNLKPRERTSLDWDNKLTLEFGNNHPCINAIEIQEMKNPVQVFLMGNSTVTDQSLEPWACWGQMIPAFFKSDNVVITNMAASGETLRSSFDRKRLTKVASMLHAGDYVFIEFAHNDQKPGAKEKPYSTYNRFLKIFADSAVSHGAIPVFVTSANRRAFDDNGKIINTLGDYPAAMRFEAEKENVAVIDLNKMTKTLYEAFGNEKSKRLFVQFPAGTFPDQDSILEDNTHFNDFGAYELAKCIVEGIKKSSLKLKGDLKPDLPAFEPSHPDDPENWDLPFTPMFSDIKPYGN